MSTLVESRSVPAERPSGAHHHPALWEKICLVLAGFTALSVIGILLLRGNALSASLIGIAHAYTSLAVAAIGACLPGYLDVGYTGRGLMIRGGGAFALFLVTLFALHRAMPSIPPETTFRVMDADTEDPVHAEIAIDYLSDGKDAEESSNHGLVVIPGTPDQITIRKATYVGAYQRRDQTPPGAGYHFDRLERDTIWLRRVDFLDAVTPRQPETSTPSSVYAEALAKEVKPPQVTIECENRTNHVVDLMLFRMPHPDGDKHPLTLVRARCEPNDPGKSTVLGPENFGSRNGGFFAVYGSILGRKAKRLIDPDVNLYLNPRTRLVIRMTGTNPHTFRVEIQRDHTEAQS